MQTGELKYALHTDWNILLMFTKRTDAIENTYALRMQLLR